MSCNPTLRLVSGDTAPDLVFHWEGSPIVGYQFSVLIRKEDGTQKPEPTTPSAGECVVDDDGSTTGVGIFHYAWKVGDLTPGDHFLELRVVCPGSSEQTIYTTIGLDVRKKGTEPGGDSYSSNPIVIKSTSTVLRIATVGVGTLPPPSGVDGRVLSEESSLAGWRRLKDTDLFSGWRVVADIAERDAIADEKRSVGMRAFIISENKLFRLWGGIANVNWEEITVSAGGSDKQAQFNDGGSIAGADGLTWDKATKTLAGSAATKITNPGAGNGSERFGADAAVGANSHDAMALGSGVVGERCTDAVAVNASIGDDAADSVGVGSVSVDAPQSVGIGSGIALASTYLESVLVGYSVSGLATRAVGIGSGITSSGVGIGWNVDASGVRSVGIGRNASSPAQNAVAIGDSASALTQHTVAISTGASASGSGALAIGRGSICVGQESSAVGRSAQVTGTRSASVGYDCRVSANNSAGLGPLVRVSQQYCVAAGYNANASHEGSFVLGRDAQSSANYRLTLGTIAGSYDMEMQLGKGIGLWGSAPPATQPSVTGSRGGNVALGSLLSALDAMGLIADNTTA